MAYEVYELKWRWRPGYGSSWQELLDMVQHSKTTLTERVSIPIVADMIDLVPALVDPWLDSQTPDAEAEAVRILVDIQKSIATRGIWLSRDGRKAVTLAGYDDD